VTVCAVVFLVALFFLKTKSEYKNLINSNQTLGMNAGSELPNGLIYGTETVGGLVSKDTDGDSIPDWEENLWGTDPTKKETTSGISDTEAIEKMKIAQGNKIREGDLSLGDDVSTMDYENLTTTDKLSRELFATVSSMTQTGALDDNTVEDITGSLVDRIKNPTAEKVFTSTDLKIIKDGSVQKYSEALEAIHKKYPTNKTVIDVLQEFVVDENTVNEDALIELDPIIDQTSGIIDGMVRMNVPSSVAKEHLGVVNALERLKENIENMKLYSIDPAIALGAMSKYEENTDSLSGAVGELGEIVNKKLSN
jgi:hypothetical protein